MAIPVIKTTYALDQETIGLLEKMARLLQVSKSEALRRAIRIAAASLPEPAPEGVEALDQLQRSLGLTTTAANRWIRDTRAERRASSARVPTDR